MIHTLDKTTFDEFVAASDTPVVVDFWATWCGPCRAMAPILDEVASELDGKVTFAKVDVDENPELAKRYDILSIPTLVRFSEGQVADRWVGAIGGPELRRRLDT